MRPNFRIALLLLHPEVLAEPHGAAPAVELELRVPDLAVVVGEAQRRPALDDLAPVAALQVGVRAPGIVVQAA
jgi:hypothetical protein